MKRGGGTWREREKKNKTTTPGLPAASPAGLGMRRSFFIFRTPPSESRGARLALVISKP